MRLPIPKSVRDKVKQRFGGRCGYCGVIPERLQVDHITAVNCKGDNSESNLMPACFSCNNFKINFDIEGFRRELQQQVHRARKYSVNFRLAERFGLIQETQVGKVIFYFETEQA